MTIYHLIYLVYTLSFLVIPNRATPLEATELKIKSTNPDSQIHAFEGQRSRNYLLPRSGQDCTSACGTLPIKDCQNLVQAIQTDMNDGILTGNVSLQPKTNKTLGLGECGVSFDNTQGTVPAVMGWNGILNGAQTILAESLFDFPLSGCDAPLGGCSPFKKTLYGVCLFNLASPCYIDEPLPSA